MSFSDARSTSNQLVRPTDSPAGSGCAVSWPMQASPTFPASTSPERVSISGPLFHFWAGIPDESRTWIPEVPITPQMPSGTPVQAPREPRSEIRKKRMM